MFTSKEQGFET